MSNPIPPTDRKRSSRWRLAGLLGLGLLVAYAAAAYIVAPDFWKGYARRHPTLEDQPGVTYTADGIPADPINIALVGTQAEVIRIMLAAGWFPADPLTMESCLEIAEASVFKRNYDDAPVSSEVLFGRKQDLAFEQPVGPDPRERHHVRFWKSEKADVDGRPVWLGAAIFDSRVGLSRTTGQITHETSPDVDRERDKLFDDLKGTGRFSKVEIEGGYHQKLEGKNGEGNPWRTDGALYEGWIQPASPEPDSPTPETKS